MAKVRSTPLHLCCQLMSMTESLEDQLQSIACVLIQTGSDLTLSDSSGYSACSLIFQSSKGLSFLEKFVSSYVDVFMLQEMEGIDLWVLAALGRAFPHFLTCLQAQLSECRTPEEISLSHTKRIEPLIGLDVSAQVEEVKRAEPEVRQNFLKLVCAKGTLEMIQPFLDSGIDLDECGPFNDRTYIRAAARSGSVEIVTALAEAGASLDTHRDWMSDSEILPASSAVDDLLERWHSIDYGRPEYTGDPESEYCLLKGLLENPTFIARDSIFFAIGRHEAPFIYECLIEAGCGRRDGMPSDTRARKALGSEVIWAIKMNSPIADLLVQHGLSLECEDRFGFSALLHALDRGEGCIDFTGMLIKAGADLTRKTSSGFTPLSFAKHNLDAQHPRLPTRDGFTKDWESRAVTLEEDVKTYHRLRAEIRTRQPSTKAGWANGKISLCILRRRPRLIRSVNLGSMQSAINLAQELCHRIYSDWSRWQQTVMTLDGVVACIGLFLTFLVAVVLAIFDFLMWAVNIRNAKPSYKVHVLVTLISIASFWALFTHG